jgi:hypothetical protein
MILLSLDLTSWSSASALPRPQLVDTFRQKIRQVLLAKDREIIHTVLSVVYSMRTNKKENQIFLIYMDIQNGAVAKSYMRKGFLILFMRKCANI